MASMTRKFPGYPHPAPGEHTLARADLSLVRERYKRLAIATSGPSP
jgi:hypothetical protein